MDVCVYECGGVCVCMYRALLSCSQGIHNSTIVKLPLKQSTQMFAQCTHRNKSSGSMGQILSLLNTLGRGLVSVTGLSKCFHTPFLAPCSPSTRGVTSNGTRCSATKSGGRENRVAGRAAKNWFFSGGLLSVR